MTKKEIDKVPFKSKLAHIAETKKRNKAFEALTDEEKRKEIAFDALNLVLIGLMKAANGYYWGNELQDVKDGSESSKDLQKRLLQPPICKVCQRGLMMVSQVRLSNSIDPMETDLDCGSSNLLKGFNLEQFQKMEREYESSYYNLPHSRRTEEKLANICCNVIVNGDFYTGDTTDYLEKWKLNIQ